MSVCVYKGKLTTLLASVHPVKPCNNHSLSLLLETNQSHLFLPNRKERRKSCQQMSTLLTNAVILLHTYMLFTGWEVRIGKNCARGLEYGRPYLRHRAQFFPIWTDQGR